MSCFMKKALLVATVVAGFAAAPTVTRADHNDYWRGYWGWYDNSYRPYYHRHYYGPSYNYGYSPYYHGGYAPYYGGGYYRGYGSGGNVRVGPLNFGWW